MHDLKILFYPLSYRIFLKISKYIKQSLIFIPLLFFIYHTHVNMYTFHINILFYIYLKALKQIAQNTYMVITEAKYHEVGGK